MTTNGNAARWGGADAVQKDGGDHSSGTVRQDTQAETQIRTGGVCADATTFARRKHLFMTALRRSGEVTGLALRVAGELIDRLNASSGDCWPSYQRLAFDLEPGWESLSESQRLNRLRM